MKHFIMAASAIVSGFCFTANATAPDNVVVYSTEKSKGSISSGDKYAYTKSFEVVVANLSDKDFDLSTLCLKAFTPNQQDFKLDTVDEKLTKGMLKKGQQVKGMAVFASDNAAVQQTALIKLTDDCK